MLQNTRQRIYGNNVAQVFVVSNATLLSSGNPMSSLANGQIGIFTYDNTDKRWESTTSALGLTTRFIVAQGRTSTDGTVAVLKTQELLGSHLAYNKKVYTAPVRMVRAVGYNGTSGALNFTTVATGDVFTLLIRNTTENSVPFQAIPFTYVAKLNDTGYDVLSSLAASISSDSNPSYRHNAGKRLYRCEVLTSTSGAAFANTATTAAVYGATTLTTSAAHGVTAGEFISLGGDVYKTVTGTTGSTLVLDRPYTGATATISNATSLDLGATTLAISTMGLRITSASVEEYETFLVSASDSLAGSDLSLVTAMTIGSGVGADIVELEEQSTKGFYGNQSRFQMTAAKFPSFPSAVASSASFYTQYRFDVNNATKALLNQATNPFTIFCAQTNSTTPAAINAALDTVFGNIQTSL